jgi:hypothetical protein
MDWVAHGIVTTPNYISVQFNSPLNGYYWAWADATYIYIVFYSDAWDYIDYCWAAKYS